MRDGERPIWGALTWTWCRVESLVERLESEWAGQRHGGRGICFLFSFASSSVTDLR